MSTSNRLTHHELEAMRRRCDLASKPPWKAYVEGRDHTSGESFVMMGQPESEALDLYLHGDATTADHDFIANARQDMPRLIAEVVLLRLEVDKLKKESGSE